MSKYEKQAWAIGICVSLSAVPLAVFGHDPLWSVCFLFGCGILSLILPHHSLWDFTETETRIAHKATAWTFYGTAIIAWALIMLVPRNKEISFSLDIITAPLLCVFLLFTGVRFILLAYLLRKERLSHAAGYRPHPNPFPGGEGKDDHIT